MPQRISANLITLNEQRNLAACLESLDWADEIVVIDGGSTDDTVPIALRYTDRVSVHPFDHYAAQRNRAIALSSGEWIFSIDADERVPAALAREIAQETAHAPRSRDGFWVPIHSRIFGRRFRHCGTQSECKMRLFRRTAGRWQGTIHETVSLAGSTARLRHGIEHNSTPDIETYLAKLNRYSAIAAERLQRDRIQSTWSRRWLSPLWTFARLYFGKLGLLDGPEGLRFCLLSAWERWITYQKLSERYAAGGGSAVVTGPEHGSIQEEWHDATCSAA